MGSEEGGKLDAYVTQSGERGLLFKQVRCWSCCLPVLTVIRPRILADSMGLFGFRR